MLEKVERERERERDRSGKEAMTKEIGSQAEERTHKQLQDSVSSKYPVLFPIFASLISHSLSWIE